jgi:hypothetical protein
VSRSLARAAALADRRVTGLSREVLAELVAELGPLWQARQDARLADRPRRRAVGAGARHRLVFVDRLLATRASAPDRVAESCRASTAIRVARSRSSSGYFLGAAMTLILTWIESLHQTRGGT